MTSLVMQPDGEVKFVKSQLDSIKIHRKILIESSEVPISNQATSRVLTIEQVETLPLKKCGF
jgi:hypothetical protein